MPRNAQIIGWGKALPSRVMTNDELSQIVDTSDEWIRTRTGIRARRIAGPRETTASLAEQAAHAAIETADVHPAHIDLVIVCTFSPEFGGMPSVASLVQDAIGAEHAGAFDLNAACAGFMYGLTIAQSMIVSGQCDTVLLIGSETLSRLLDWSDRSTCILFGDGAGAMVIQATEERSGILSSVLGSDGSGAELLAIPAGGSRLPASPQTIVDRQHYIQMNGREVYKFAVNVMGNVAKEALARAGLSADDVALFIPHQANLRIIESAARSLGVPADRVFVNVGNYGNTSAASIPIALCEAIDEGLVKTDDRLVFVGFGGGLAWGASVIQWGVPATVHRRGLRLLWHGMWYSWARVRSVARRIARKVDAIFLDGTWSRNGHSGDMTARPGRDGRPTDHLLDEPKDQANTLDRQRQ
ncbi:MAG: 3-oxoacyl-ACP synthase [Dehalococcoidia bacterium]|nr:3-oxoacyl-ACP synthase [Dehalococcoidia bacterium]